MLPVPTKHRYRHSKLILSAKLLSHFGLANRASFFSLVRRLMLIPRHHNLCSATTILSLKQKTIKLGEGIRKAQKAKLWNFLPLFKKKFAFRYNLRNRGVNRCLFSGVSRGLRFGVGRLFLIRSASRGGDFSLGLSRW